MAAKNVTKYNQEKAENKGPKRSVQRISDPVVRSLLKKIVSGAEKPDDGMIDVARDVVSLKAYVEQHGLMGGKTWYEWAPKALKGIGDINKLRLLNDLAGAPLDEARKILAAHRRDGARRTRRFRERAKAKTTAAKNLAIERRWIIHFAKTAQLQDVSKAWKYIKREFDA
jgi:hypothetical protein